jgi:Domain of unknown function (DUF4338)
VRPIPLLTLESRIKRRLRRHFRDLGFCVENGVLVPPDDSKRVIRELHSSQRAERLLKEADFILKQWPILKNHFADGRDIHPIKIRPRLELVRSNSWQGRLFRLATLTWSIPVSHGYGRRMRYLVWDDYNGKLMGLIALGDPVFNLRARDQAIGWTGKQRDEMLVNTMDAYVLGAIPPYNRLLCGKLVACLLKSKEIHHDFQTRYGHRRGIISRRVKHASLVLITTSSALGKSSVYNRLVLNGCRILEPVGFTSGWGHFHIPEDLFDEIRRYLRARRDAYATNHEFGSGPNWRLRTIRKGLETVGIDSALLKHGIGREVFICKIASNATEFLNGRAKRPVFRALSSVRGLSNRAKKRWIIPRAVWDRGYYEWTREQVQSLLQCKVDSATIPGSARI